MTPIAGYIVEAVGWPQAIDVAFPHLVLALR